MIGRQRQEQQQLFCSFDLDAVVPDDHLVRRFSAVLDLSWIHAELAPHYSPIGRPSIDPALMIRILIVGYVFAIRAYAQTRRDRKKVEMLFAHLKRILRLGRLRLREPRGAQFEFTLAAIAQNLRRLAKLTVHPPDMTAKCVA
jgi:DDE family transposase